ncbi:DUF2778 domain-containing protein [Massilia polaris]
MSTFKSNTLSIPAFSGFGTHVNRRAFACQAGSGPIPPGRYYIFDRQSGGLLGAFRDMLNGHDDWFALYAIDRTIDDETFCNQVKRGNFRLHPKGPSGISQGCITVADRTDHQKLRAYLKASTPSVVPGSQLQAYGVVVVR